MSSTATAVIAVLVAVLGLIGALMAFLIKESRGAGRREEKLDGQMKVLAKIEERTEGIPALIVRVGQLEEIQSRVISDITDLQRRGRYDSHHDEE
jgi:hypothetical protein